MRIQKGRNNGPHSEPPGRKRRAKQEASKQDEPLMAGHTSSPVKELANKQPRKSKSENSRSGQQFAENTKDRGRAI